MIKLDIGSGVAKKAGYITVDIDPSVNADVTGDFMSDNFKYDSVDEIRVHHLLEHLNPNNKVKIMRKLYDMLKPGGILDSEVPLFPHSASVQDPTHISFWSKESFWYFIKGNRFGEAVAKRHSTPMVPLFEFDSEWYRGEKSPYWGYGIKLKRPKL